MKVFLSWSGEYSHDVAKAFNDWLPQVINALEPWISSEDIKKGTRWFEEIAMTLSGTNAGIIFVTSENLNAPWLNFEAGALSKSLDKSNVIPFLVDLSNSDLTGPLTNFNTVSNSKHEILKLLKTLNGCIEDSKRRDNSKLEEAFEVWWEKLEAKLSEINQSKPTIDKKIKKRPQEEILEEILKLVRSIHSNTDKTEKQGVTQSIFGKSRGVSIAKLASDVGTTSERLIEQFADAGIKFESDLDIVDDEQKKHLLEHLSKIHSGGSSKSIHKVTFRR